MLNPYNITLHVYAESEQEAKELEGALSDFIINKYNQHIKEHDINKYDCLMRKLSEVLYGKHYQEDIANADVALMYSIDANGRELHGAHWTADEIEAATSAKTYPKGTTKCDKYVAYNATWHDLHSKFTDEQILDIAYLFWFSDKDWKSDGKIWDYMSANQ